MTLIQLKSFLLVIFVIFAELCGILPRTAYSADSKGQEEEYIVEEDDSEPSSGGTSGSNSGKNPAFAYTHLLPTPIVSLD